MIPVVMITFLAAVLLICSGSSHPSPLGLYRTIKPMRPASELMCSQGVFNQDTTIPDTESTEVTFMGGAVGTVYKDGKNIDIENYNYDL